MVEKKKPKPVILNLVDLAKALGDFKERLTNRGFTDQDGCDLALFAAKRALSGELTIDIIRESE